MSQPTDLRADQIASLDYAGERLTAALDVLHDLVGWPDEARARDDLVEAAIQAVTALANHLDETYWTDANRERYKMSGQPGDRLDESP